jgi:hypothetical protein
MSEQAKTVHTSDRPAIVIGTWFYCCNKLRDESVFLEMTTDDRTGNTPRLINSSSFVSDRNKLFRFPYRPQLTGITVPVLNSDTSKILIKNT